MDDSNFNSTMVQLKVQKSYNDLLGGAEFQFHYGSIKRETGDYRAKLVAGFQFHYGSIKSPYSFSLSRKSPYFNSTMVQLKVIENGIKKCLFTGFSGQK